MARRERGRQIFPENVAFKERCGVRKRRVKPEQLHWVDTKPISQEADMAGGKKTWGKRSPGQMSRNQSNPNTCSPARPQPDATQ